MTQNSQEKDRQTTDKTGAVVTVADDPQKRRYTVSVEGEVVGFAQYADRTTGDGTQRVFYHTEVDEAFGGRGLATILVAGALDDVRTQGKRIVGVCPLVSAFLKKHPEFADITDPVRKDILTWLGV
jgi:predicted GNAT family acetyltransferase